MSCMAFVLILVLTNQQKYIFKLGKFNIYRLLSELLILSDVIMPGLCYKMTIF